MSDRVYSALRIFLLSTLCVWGAYTFMAYIAQNTHLSILLDDAGKQTLAAACGTDASALCKSVNALLPFVRFGISRMAPLGLYGILLLLAYGAWIVFSKRGKRAEVQASLRPWMIALAFFAAVWLMLTSLSFARSGSEPYTRIYEPTEAIYRGVDDEGMAVLQENFTQLQERGCLTEIGTVADGRARAFSMSRLCMQRGFITRVLPHMLLIGMLLLALLAVGRGLLRALRLRIPVSPTASEADALSPLLELAFSAGLGSAAFIALLWLLAQLGVYTAPVGWAALLVLPALCFKDVWYWFQSFLHRPIRYRGASTSLLPLVALLLLSYLAFNFLNVIRPFPIGWDDLGKYMNQPRLLVSYGKAIPQMGAFLWEYLTSLGFLLFGYDSVFGATFSMVINWMAGLLAVIATYAFARTYLGPHRGALSALLYYSLPMVGHFSFADMKIDNAVYMFGALSLLAVFLALFPADDAEEDAADDTPPPPSRSAALRLMVLAGVLGGLAFATKPTSIMSVMASGTVLFGAGIHVVGFLGAFALAWLVFLQQGRLDLIDIGRRITGNPDVFSPMVVGGILLVIAAVCMTYIAIKHRAQLLVVLGYAGVFIASFILSVLPWLAFNNISHGNLVPQLIFTSRDTLTPVLLTGGETPPKALGRDVRSLPPDLQIDAAQCKGTGKQEELDRYWGYRTGWSHYLTLPWRAVMNTDSAGYYVTLIPALLLFPLLLLLPFFWTRRGRWSLWLWIATLFMLVQWMLFANGIPWYGIGTFLGLAVLLETLVARAPDRISRSVAGTLIALSLLVAFSMRFWQYELQSNVFEYSLGKVSYETMRERTIPYYDDIREMIDTLQEQRPSQPYVYRIGTFIPYFIPKNLETLPISDHQLDLFNCLYKERDAALTLQRLKALGFGSIIFDTNTQTIESDPNGSLHQKVAAFVDFVNTQGLGISVLISDPERGIAYVVLP